MTEPKPKRRLRIEYDSPVILTVSILALIVLIVNKFTDNLANAFIFSTYRSSLYDPMFYVRLFLHPLGHSDFQHYFGNISLMLIIGPIVERRYGSIDVLISMLFTAFAEGIVHCIVSPSAMLGASGIVFMLIFLAAVENIGDGRLSLTFIFVAVIYFGQAIYEGIFVKDNVSQLCHIVGGLCGILCGWVMRKRMRRDPRGHKPPTEK